MSNLCNAAKSLPVVNILGVDIAGVFRSSLNTSGVFKEIVGREERVINSIFSCMGYKYKLTIVPFGRHLSLFNSMKGIDAVATVYGNVKLKGFSTKSHVTYYNGVTYINSRFEKDISSIVDMKGKRVIAFVGARKMFPRLNDYIPHFKSYIETANQRSHSKMLFNNRVDFVISDAVIFAHNTADLQQSGKKIYRKMVKFKQIFKPQPFFMYFKSKILRKKFNKCLSFLESTRELEKLNIEYYNEMIINK